MNKIALLELTPNRPESIYKDFMGGYGWAFKIGNSLRARAIQWVKRHGEVMPNVLFGYLAGIFSECGWEVEIVEDKIPEADLVIIASSMVDFKNEVSWAKKIKDAGKKVGFIGPFAGAMAGLFMPPADFIISGEPEAAAYKIAKGEILPVGMINVPPIEDLDKLPFPKWDFFPVDNYSYIPALRQKPFLPVLSSRGCSYGCNYCPYHVIYKYRTRTPENVLAELRELVEKFGVKAVLFRDPIFSFNRERTLSIAKGIKDKKLNIRWACETRLDHLDEELLIEMYSAGCRVINVGIESSDENILKQATRKPIAIKHQERMIKFCDRLGIRVTAFYILGLPDDTRESILRTIKYAKRLNTHVAQFFISTPFPGTRFFEQIKDNIIESDWQKFDCYTPVLAHKNLSKNDLLELKEKAFVEYYFRPRYIFKFIVRAIKDFLN